MRQIGVLGRSPVLVGARDPSKPHFPWLEPRSDDYVTARYVLGELVQIPSGHHRIGALAVAPELSGDVLNCRLGRIRDLDKPQRNPLSG